MEVALTAAFFPFLRATAGSAPARALIGTAAFPLVLKESIFAAFDLLASVVGLMVGLNVPRMQLKVRFAWISSIANERAALSASLRTQTTFASLLFTQRARLCFLISETIEAVSPKQLTA
jgi:hypothetical protein